MRFAQRPVEERAEALRGVGVTVDKIDERTGRIIIRVPGYLGLPLGVNEQGSVGFMGLADTESDIEFSLPRGRDARDIAQSLICDLYGVATEEELTSGLRKLGRRPIQRDSWSSDPIRVTLLKGPPRVVAQVKGRTASIEEKTNAPPIPEFSIKRAEPRLRKLQEAVNLIHRIRDKVEVRSVKDYLPPIPEELARLSKGCDFPGESDSWSSRFRRIRNHPSGLPRFFLCYSHYDLWEMDGYSGGNADLDGLLALFGIFGFEGEKWGSSSPANASDHNLRLWFLDGGVRIYSGNYIPGKHGVYVMGFLALRFLVWHLGLKQPRRFKGEEWVPTAQELEGLGRFPVLPQGHAPVIEWWKQDSYEDWYWY